MDEEGWVKDKKPYLVFKCSKCNQYSYVKTTQKTKKCLRCGRAHQVKDLETSAIKVKGISEALKEVQARQNMLGKGNFRTEGGFTVAVNYNKNKNNFEEDNLGKFKGILKRLSDLYDEFPRFLIDIMAEEYHIPQKEIKFQINKLKHENFLTEIKNSYFKVEK